MNETLKASEARETERNLTVALAPTAHPRKLDAGSMNERGVTSLHEKKSRWYVAQTLARREAYAIENLKTQGFTTFMPIMRRTVLHARKIQERKVALFPGYVFVSLDLSRDRWRSVNGTRGVAHLIMGETAPQPVPDGVIETLVTYVDECGVFQAAELFRKGQLVRVVSGSLSNMLAEILDLDGKGRVRVLLEMMNTKVIVNLEIARLERV